MEQQLYSFEGTAEHLLATLERAHADDKRAERLKAKWGGVGCLGAGLIFAGIFLGIVTGFVYLFALPVLGIPLAIFGFVKATRHGRFDVDDRKLGAARRVLSVLRADIPAGWPIGLTVDFRPYDKAGPPLEKVEPGWGKPKQYKYAQQWLELRANLADGCSVVAALSDKVSRKEKPKRKRTKVAETFATEASVSVRLARHYGSAEAVAARLSGTSPERTWTVRASQGRGRVVRVTVAVPPGRRVRNRGTTENGMDQLVSGDTLLRTLHWVYGAIAAGRRVA
jgi:hypothetical protein